MAKAKPKYLINHLISQLPRQISIRDIVKELEQNHGISRVTFYRDRSLTIKDESSIPSDRLDTYAALLGVTPDQLKNYTIKKIVPIANRKAKAA